MGLFNLINFVQFTKNNDSVTGLILGHFVFLEKKWTLRIVERFLTDVSRQTHCITVNGGFVWSQSEWRIPI